MRELTMNEVGHVDGGLVWLVVVAGAALLSGCATMNRRPESPSGEVVVGEPEPVAE